MPISLLQVRNAVSLPIQLEFNLQLTHWLCQSGDHSKREAATSHAPTSHAFPEPLDVKSTQAKVVVNSRKTVSLIYAKVRIEVVKE